MYPQKRKHFFLFMNLEKKNKESHCSNSDLYKSEDAHRSQSICQSACYFVVSTYEVFDSWRCPAEDSVCIPARMLEKIKLDCAAWTVKQIQFLAMVLFEMHAWMGGYRLYIMGINNVFAASWQFSGTYIYFIIIDGYFSLIPKLKIQWTIKKRANWIITQE